MANRRSPGGPGRLQKRTPVVVAVCSDSPRLDGAVIEHPLRHRDFIAVFCYFPFFFVPATTGFAWYLSKKYSPDCHRPGYPGNAGGSGGFSFALRALR